MERNGWTEGIPESLRPLPFPIFFGKILFIVFINLFVILSPVQVKKNNRILVGRNDRTIFGHKFKNNVFSGSKTILIVLM